SIFVLVFFFNHPPTSHIYPLSLHDALPISFADFVAFDDVGRIDLISGLRVHFEIFDAVPGILVDLMKADFLPLARRRIQGDGTRDEREFEVAFPIRAGGHGAAPVDERHCVNRWRRYPIPAPGWRHFSRTGLA